MESDIFEVIETALKKAGYTVLDGDDDSIIVRHKNSDYDYEIKVNASINEKSTGECNYDVQKQLLLS